MTKNTIWVIFLVLILGFSLWFVFRAGYELIAYYQLSEPVPVTIEKWEVVQLEANKYGLEAAYSYDFQEKVFHGRGRLNTFYPNPWAAKQALEKIEPEPQTIWLNPNQPENGVLERKFPYKVTLSAAVLVGLFVYFMCLGLYAGVKHERRRQ